MTFSMVCRQAVNDLKTMEILEAETKKQAVMMMMMEKGVMMSWFALKDSQIIQQFNKLFHHWKMCILSLTEKDTLLLLAAP